MLSSVHQSRKVFKNTLGENMKYRLTRSLPLLTLFTILLTGIGFSVNAQNDAPSLWLKAEALIKQGRNIEAIDSLKRIIELDPKDADAQYELGSALIARSMVETDPVEQKKSRISAREAFVKSQELGNNTQFVRAMIESLPIDGNWITKYSNNPISDAHTIAGEQAFAQGKYDDAIDQYKKAIETDPKNYFAAVFTGDMYLQKADFQNAEVWYQKAIVIDPYIETAYRYSATPLMRQNKYDEARSRYVEAWITSPYSRMAVSGILQWAQATNTKLGHPRVEPPKTETGEDGKQNTTININPLADDGSMAWISYSATKDTWKKEKFAKTYPNEKVYRSSLAEEADALRSVVEMAKTLKPKALSQQIAVIEKMDKDGVLEAFILMAMADEGIAQDHLPYLKANRDKMRLYVNKYVIDQKY